MLDGCDVGIVGVLLGWELGAQYFTRGSKIFRLSKGIQQVSKQVSFAFPVIDTRPEENFFIGRHNPANTMPSNLFASRNTWIKEEAVKFGSGPLKLLLLHEKKFSCDRD